MKLFKEIKEGFLYFNEGILILFNSILLFFVYFFGFGLTYIIAKFFNKNFMDIKLKHDKTYWQDFNLGKDKKENYYKQF